MHVSDVRSPSSGKLYTYMNNDIHYTCLFAGEEGNSGPDYANIESLEEDEEDEGGQVRSSLFLAPIDMCNTSLKSNIT